MEGESEALDIRSATASEEAATDVPDVPAGDGEGEPPQHIQRHGLMLQETY